jgi:2-desacetyl-2-hydroxyethyl bacteriochlorophyllide A dehydrogenase
MVTEHKRTDRRIDNVSAVGLVEFGGPEVLQLLQVPVHEPSDDGVVVDVAYAAINPADVSLRTGKIAQFQPSREQPAVPGMDFSGTVTHAGATSGFAVGDTVMGMRVPGPFPQFGGYASTLVVPSDSLTRAPSNVGLQAASAVPMNGLTAMLALDRLALEPGSVIGVTGAAGVLGAFAVSLAHVRGLKVVAVARPDDEEALIALGADIVVPRGPDVAQRITDAAGQQLDGLLDAALIGPELLACVETGGAVVIIRVVDWPQERDIRVKRIVVSEYDRQPDKLAQLREYVERGVLVPQLSDTFAPADTAEAHRRLDRGGIRGRMTVNWESTR